jgi:hypothetical protein
MTTPQKFLESFLKERAAAYSTANAGLLPLYERCFGEPLSGHAGDLLLRDKAEHAFEDVKQSGELAVIVTREHFELRDLRMRYHLVAVGQDWKIVRIDWECFLCLGTGRMRSGKACRKCGGEGWYDSRKNKS